VGGAYRRRRAWPYLNFQSYRSAPNEIAREIEVSRAISFAGHPRLSARLGVP
jgi:hypothetical protein